MNLFLKVISFSFEKLSLKRKKFPQAIIIGISSLERSSGVIVLCVILARPQCSVIQSDTNLGIAVMAFCKCG